jgi:hypothetical protein
MAAEDLSAPNGITAPAAEGAAAQNTTITAAKFKSLIDMLDTYMQHSHTFTDDYFSNCQCQCGRGSI